VGEQTTQLRTVMIRNLDIDVWRSLRAEAERRRWDTAAMVEHVIREWFAAQSTAA
jgi:hypothetical protein